MYKRSIPSAPKANQTQTPTPKTKTEKPMKGSPLPSMKKGFTNQAQSKKK